MLRLIRRPTAAGLPRMSVLALLVLSALASASPSSAQQPVVAELRGRVLLADDPLPSARVVLHRVGMAGSGPVDSVQTAGDGSFRFRLPNVPDPSAIQEVWFASVERDGVNYFSAPVHMAAQLDSVHTIRVFDTETAPEGGAPLAVQARYSLLEQEGDAWFVTDLLHVLNEGARTLIAPSGGATFAYPLPPGASDLQVGGDQISPDAAELVDGNLRVTSAIPPGEREFVVRYRVPDPFVVLRYPGATGEAELLVREPVPPLEVAGLQAAQPVEMQVGVRYQRYVGQQLQEAVVAVREAVVPPDLPLGWIAVIIALVLTGAGIFAVLRPHPAVALAGSAPAALDLDPRVSPFERRQRLLLELARLDAARPPGAGEDDAWGARRRELLERVRELERAS